MAETLKNSTKTTKPRAPRVAASGRRPRADRDRLSCRIDARIKARAEDAARLLGQDLSAFTEIALNEKAEAVIERQERIILSERDYAIFVEAIENPKPISARLKAAAQEYKKVRAEHPELNW